MLEFLLTDANLPFTLALGLMLGIALLEGLGLLAGFDISRSLDDLLFDAEFEVEMGESEVPGGLAFLAWLHIGIVPMLVLLVVFLTAFGCMGLVVQSWPCADSGTRSLPRGPPAWPCSPRFRSFASWATVSKDSFRTTPVPCRRTPLSGRPGPLSSGRLSPGNPPKLGCRMNLARATTSWWNQRRQRRCLRPVRRCSSWSVRERCIEG